MYTCMCNVCTHVYIGELLLLPGFGDCALCLCVLCMDGRWSTWVVRVGAQGWACGPSAFHSDYSYICRLVALFFIFLSR